MTLPRVPHGFVVLVVVVLAVTACDHGDKARVSAAAAPLVAASPTASAEARVAVAAVPTTASVSPTPRAAARRPDRAASPQPKPVRRRVKITGPQPPPPRRMPAPTRACPYHEGTDAPRADVKTALVTAANTRFFRTMDIPLPAELMKAVAWQESGWQSTIIACDGGIGTMQIMPDTATWMNQYFGTSYDAHTLTGNTMIGAALLTWLAMYFGDVYFNGDYTLDPAACADETSPCLLNALIASYNFGFGAVDTPAGLVIPNPQYVGNVRALMTECVCLTF